MKIIRLTNEELDYLTSALSFYCDDTSHERKDLEKEDGIIAISPGLNPNTRESKILESVRNKLEGKKPSEKKSEN